MMSMNVHVGDDALVRHLDGEEIALEDARHLRSCVACQARLDTLRETTDIVADFLESTADEIAGPEYDADFLERLSACGSGAGAPSSARARRRFTPPATLRWAAAVALLGVALTVGPVRAWVTDLMTAVWEVVARPAAAPDAASGDGATEVSVPDPGPRVVVGLSEEAPPGRVVITAADLGSLVARLEGATGGEILVLPGRLEVDAPDPAAVLFVEVPVGVMELVLEVDDVVVGAWSAEAWANAPLILILDDG